MKGSFRCNWSFQEGKPVPVMMVTTLGEKVLSNQKHECMREF